MLPISAILLSTALAANAPESAYVGSSPVRIAECTATDRFTQISDGDAMEYQFGGSALHVRFTNDAQKPIDAVTFAVTENGKTTDVVDKGAYAQGSTVSQGFDQGLTYAGTASCQVASVDFADGTSWSAAGTATPGL
jgi:hypothetical protein